MHIKIFKTLHSPPLSLLAKGGDNRNTGLILKKGFRYPRPIIVPRRFCDLLNIHLLSRLRNIYSKTYSIIIIILKNLVLVTCGELQIVF